MKRVIFLHRSVGNNLINDADVYGLLRPRHDIVLCDFDQNTSTLRDDTSARKTEYAMPGGNTRPQDYAQLFCIDAPSTLKDFVMQHDIVIIKSCYPNSNIRSVDELETIKRYYQSIAQFFARHHTKRLLIMTSPPLTPSMTNTTNAARARELSSWLVSQKFTDDVLVYDLFDRLAADNGRQANMLRRDYRRLLPFDSHPNRQASQHIAPHFISAIIQTTEN